MVDISLTSKGSLESRINVDTDSEAIEVLEALVSSGYISQFGINEVTGFLSKKGGQPPYTVVDIENSLYNADNEDFKEEKALKIQYSREMGKEGGILTITSRQSDTFPVNLFIEKTVQNATTPARRTIMLGDHINPFDFDETYKFVQGVLQQKNLGHHTGPVILFGRAKIGQAGGGKPFTHYLGVIPSMADFEKDPLILINPYRSTFEAQYGAGALARQFPQPVFIYLK